MIELAPKSTIPMTFTEARIYCFLLGDGWRLPTTADAEELHTQGCYLGFLNCWCHEQGIIDHHIKRYILPVRDLKDD
jgi:hypothetical protein